MLKIEQYSEKSLVILGNSRAIKDNLRVLGCVFNNYLTISGEIRSGWLCKKEHQNMLFDLLDRLEVCYSSEV